MTLTDPTVREALAAIHKPLSRMKRILDEIPPIREGGPFDGRAFPKKETE